MTDAEDFAEDYEEALREAGEAVAALSCPYYRGTGTCQSGCYAEPSCRTDAPTDGWMAQLGRAAHVLEQLPEERR